jgi:hypothetical protein
MTEADLNSGIGECECTSSMRKYMVGSANGRDLNCAGGTPGPLLPLIDCRYQYMKVNCGSFRLTIKKSSIDFATNVNKFEGSIQANWWTQPDLEWYTADSEGQNFNTNVEISLGASNGLTIKVEVPSTNVSY